MILPTWTGGLRVHYQVQRWWQELWSRCGGGCDRPLTGESMVCAVAPASDDDRDNDDYDDGSIVALARASKRLLCVVLRDGLVEFFGRKRPHLWYLLAGSQS